MRRATTGAERRIGGRGARGAVVALAALAALLAGGGCGTDAATVKRDFVFKPKPTANAGRPVYLLVRSVSENDFLTDSYRKITSLVYPNATDPSVLGVLLLWPGREQRVRLEVPKAKAVGIYCLFTTPGDPWKLLLPQPLAKELRAVLEPATLVLERSAKEKDD